ncbi:MAG: LapA family protein [Anaerolinea sp.]|nr:LapA family protein [Anaerolinea sp.]
MFDNLVLIAVVIILLWLASFGFYLYTSRQHRDLQQAVESLKRQLDVDHDDGPDKVREW